jgi:hypothetical protein
VTGGTCCLPAVLGTCLFALSCRGSCHSRRGAWHTSIRATTRAPAHTSPRAQALSSLDALARSILSAFVRTPPLNASSAAFGAVLDDAPLARGQVGSSMLHVRCGAPLLAPAAGLASTSTGLGPGGTAAIELQPGPSQMLAVVLPPANGAPIVVRRHRVAAARGSTLSLATRVDTGHRRRPPGQNRCPNSALIHPGRLARAAVFLHHPQSSPDAGVALPRA